MAKHGQENQIYGQGAVLDILGDLLEKALEIIPPPKPKPTPKPEDKKTGK